MTENGDLSHAGDAGALLTRFDSCRVWGGTRARYQVTVQDELYLRGVATTPHMWVTPSCGTAMCLEHYTVAAPRRIAYPKGVCVYCGLIATTADHLIPRTWSGETARRFVATVPACVECNSTIGDKGSYQITDRRSLAHEGITRQYRRALRTPDYTDEQLAEYGPTLRAHIRHSIGLKAQTKERLAWPTDPDYDLRAFQHSGITDPDALGLL